MALGIVAAQPPHESGPSVGVPALIGSTKVGNPEGEYLRQTVIEHCII